MLAVEVEAAETLVATVVVEAGASILAEASPGAEVNRLPAILALEAKLAPAARSRWGHLTDASVEAGLVQASVGQAAAALRFDVTCGGVGT